jgi:hypothetical protein
MASKNEKWLIAKQYVQMYRSSSLADEQEFLLYVMVKISMKNDRIVKW